MKAHITIRKTGIKLTDILCLISQGFSPQQILEIHTVLNPGDIMAAASLALGIMEDYVAGEDGIEVYHTINVTARSRKLINLSRLREKYPRAYAPWKTDEEARLIELYRAGACIARIAEIHERQPGAVRSRLQKLGLIPPREKA